MHMNEKIYILILKSYLSPFIRIFRFNVEWWKYILSQYLNYMQYKLSITAWQDLNKGNLFLPWLAFENIFCTFLFTSTPILTSMDDVMKRWIHFEITCQNWHKLWQICPINRYQIWSVMEHMKAAFKLIQKTQKWMCFDKKVEMLWWHVFWQSSICCSQNPSSHLGNQILICFVVSLTHYCQHRQWQSALPHIEKTKGGDMRVWNKRVRLTI